MQSCEGQGTCESQQSCSCTNYEDQCGCGGCCGGDPVKCSMILWKDCFYQAMESLMVDLIKAKIQKSFGSKLDKTADLVVAAMDTKWQAKMTIAKAKAELKAKLQEEMKSGK